MEDRQKPLCEASTCRNYGKHDYCYVGRRAYRTCIYKEFPNQIKNPLDQFPIIVDEAEATEDLVERVRRMCQERGEE